MHPIGYYVILPYTCEEFNSAKLCSRWWRHLSWFGLQPLTPSVPHRSLRSNKGQLLTVPRVNTKSGSRKSNWNPIFLTWSSLHSCSVHSVVQMMNLAALWTLLMITDWLARVWLCREYWWQKVQLLHCFVLLSSFLAPMVGVDMGCDEVIVNFNEQIMKWP